MNKSPPRSAKRKIEKSNELQLQLMQQALLQTSTKKKILRPQSTHGKAILIEPDLLPMAPRKKLSQNLTNAPVIIVNNNRKEQLVKANLNCLAKQYVSKESKKKMKFVTEIQKLMAIERQTIDKDHKKERKKVKRDLQKLMRK